MFVKGSILGIVTKAPIIEYFDTSVGENRKKSRLTISTFTKKFKEPGYYENDVNFICWGDLPGGMDFHSLKEGHMVYAEFTIRRETYKTKEGNIAHVLRYYLTSLRKLGTVPVDKFRRLTEEAVNQEEDRLYDGTASTNREPKEDTVKMEDIF